MTVLILLIVSLCIIFCVATVFLTLSLHKEKKELAMCKMAANSLIREELLVDSLKNTGINDVNKRIKNSIRIMICIKAKSSGKTQRYVFDPAKGVSIGRSSSQNVFINDKLVDAEHCGIYVRNKKVYIKDYNSNMGINVKRGIFASYYLSGGKSLGLKTDDILIIGNTKLRITLFYFDMSIM